jgi:hypothetical protein
MKISSERCSKSTAVARVRKIERLRIAKVSLPPFGNATSMSDVGGAAGMAHPKRQQFATEV